MSFDQVLAPFRKWWWLILSATVVAGVSSYWVVQNQPKEYESKVILMVGTAAIDPNPTSADFYLGQQLAGLYAEIGQRDSVRDQVRDVLGLEVLPEYSIRAMPNSQFIEIVVIDTIPERAQAVANEVARQVINQSPTGSISENSSRQVFIEEQLEYLQERIEVTEEEIANTQLLLAELKSAREIRNTQAEIIGQQSKLLSLQSNYAALLDNSRSGAINSISFVDAAHLPTTPSNPNTLLFVGLSASLGLLLGFGGAVILERLDYPTYSIGAIENELKLPVLGSIPYSHYLEKRARVDQGIQVLERPNSLISESFHLLRANLKFVWGEKIPKTILISSVSVGAGKSTVAENLAAGLVKSGMNIMLIDADFRKPSLHERFDLPEGPGLSDAIEENLSLNKLAHTLDDKRFKILTSGSARIDPVGYVSSLKFVSALGKIKAGSALAILDGPPLFIADALIMASKVDGVLIILNPDEVSLEVAKEHLIQLQRADAKILGVILNKVRRIKIGKYFDDASISPQRISGEKESTKPGSDDSGDAPEAAPPFKKDEDTF